MTASDFLEAMGEIDDRYIQEAKQEPKQKPKFKKTIWIGVGSLAACFLIILALPLSFLHMRMMNNGSSDYVSEAYENFSVYFVQGDEICQESTGVYGGDSEMFGVWKEKNNIGSDVGLIELSLLLVAKPEESGSPNDNEEARYIVRVKVSASMEDYFTQKNRALLTESLMKTIASYHHVTIDDMELIFS